MTRRTTGVPLLPGHSCLVTAPPADAPYGERVLYQTEDGRTRIESRFEAVAIPSS